MFPIIHHTLSLRLTENMPDKGVLADPSDLLQNTNMHLSYLDLDSLMHFSFLNFPIAFTVPIKSVMDSH